MIRIQVRQALLWLDIMLLNDTDDYSFQMERVKDQYPNSRVRVIDERGKVLDSI